MKTNILTSTPLLPPPLPSKGGFVFLDVFNTDIVTWLRSPNDLEKNATYCLSFAFAALFPDSGAELTVVK